jgi:hypothetical protein
VLTNLLIVLVLILVGILPTPPYCRGEQHGRLSALDARERRLEMAQRKSLSR